MMELRSMEEVERLLGSQADAAFQARPPLGADAIEAANRDLDSLARMKAELDAALGRQTILVAIGALRELMTQPWGLSGFKIEDAHIPTLIASEPEAGVDPRAQPMANLLWKSLMRISLKLWMGFVGAEITEQNWRSLGKALDPDGFEAWQAEIESRELRAIAGAAPPGDSSPRI